MNQLSTEVTRVFLSAKNRDFLKNKISNFIGSDADRFLRHDFDKIHYNYAYTIKRDMSLTDSLPGVVVLDHVNGYNNQFFVEIIDLIRSHFQPVDIPLYGVSDNLPVTRLQSDHRKRTADQLLDQWKDMPAKLVQAREDPSADAHGDAWGCTTSAFAPAGTRRGGVTFCDQSRTNNSHHQDTFYQNTWHHSLNDTQEYSESRVVPHQRDTGMPDLNNIGCSSYKTYIPANSIPWDYDNSGVGPYMNRMTQYADVYPNEQFTDGAKSYNSHSYGKKSYSPIMESHEFPYKAPSCYNFASDVPYGQPDDIDPIYPFDNHMHMTEEYVQSRNSSKQGVSKGMAESPLGGYVHQVNRGFGDYTKTAFGTSTPESDKRLLERRTFRSAWADKENGIPRYEQWLYRRHVDRDVAENMRPIEFDYQQRGHDMTSLHARIDHKNRNKFAQVKY